MKLKRPSLRPTLSLPVLVLLLASCSDSDGQSNGADLLSIEVENSEDMNRQELNQRLAQILEKNPASRGNIKLVVSQLISIDRYRKSVISVEKNENTYAATIIFDDVPEDDSLSGYHYFLTLKKTAKDGLEVTEAKESWRCWPGRGHRNFSTKPCT